MLLLFDAEESVMLTAMLRFDIDIPVARHVQIGNDPVHLYLRTISPRRRKVLLWLMKRRRQKHQWMHYGYYVSTYRIESRRRHAMHRFRHNGCFISNPVVWISNTPQ